MSWFISSCGWVNNFSRGHRVVTTLNGALSSGASTFTVDETDISYYWKRGDVVLLGPSSDADNLGKYEQVRVSSIAGAVITLDGTLAYDYADEDEVVGIGMGAPEGMSYLNYEADALYTYGIRQRESASGVAKGIPYEGYLNQYTGWWFRLVSSAVVRGMVIIPTVYRAREGGKYRLVAHARIPASAAGGITVRFSESGISSGTVATAISGSGTLPWTKISGVSSVGVTYTSGQTTPGYLQIYNTNLADDSDYIGLDCCYLTHAHNCGATAEAAGVYTLPKNPSQIIEKDVETEVKIENMFNQTIFRDSLDSFNVVDLSLSWVDATEEMLKILGQLEYWQNQGYLTCIETDDYAMRPLFGFFTWRYIFGHWDLNRIGVELTFKGVR